MAHPYRPSPPVPERAPDPPPDDTLARYGMIAVFWSSSVLRFALAVTGGEPFGFQPALALALTVLTPVVVARGFLARSRID
jgi:hypothetical protein